MSEERTLAVIRICMLACVALLAGVLGGCAEAPQKKEPARVLVFPSPPDEGRFVFERSLYTSGDVTEKDRNSVLRQMLTGEGERGGEGIYKPYGLAVREGRVYVADSVGASVKVFDVPGQRLSNIGTDEQGTLGQPLGLDIDSQHRLYVVDASSKYVKVFDANGKFTHRIGGPKLFQRPTGVAVTADGERLYVVDTGGVERREEHRVRVFHGQSGAHLFDFGGRGSGNGQFNLARDISVAPDGRVYVVDTGNFRIQVFDRDGKFLSTFGTVGRQPGSFARPREVAVDRDGKVYVSDAAFGNLQIFDSEGQLLMHIGERGERDQPARYMLPAGIAVDLDGRIYMADEFFRRIDVYRPASLGAGEGFVAKAGGSAQGKAR